MNIKERENTSTKATIHCVLRDCSIRIRNTRDFRLNIKIWSLHLTFFDFVASSFWSFIKPNDKHSKKAEKTK